MQKIVSISKVIQKITGGVCACMWVWVCGCVSVYVYMCELGWSQAKMAVLCYLQDDFFNVLYFVV